MGRMIPSACEHGKVFDWGDFGGDDAEPEPCAECAKQHFHGAAEIVWRAATELLHHGFHDLSEKVYEAAEQMQAFAERATTSLDAWTTSNPQQTTHPKGATNHVH